MKVWVEVWNPTYTEKLGRLEPIMASYKRKLDEAGGGRATFASEPKSLSILQVRRIVEVWLSDVKLVWDSGDESFKETVYKRKLGAFVIETTKPTPKNRTITVSGSGVMSKLIDELALPGLFFENQSVTTVLEELAALAGWTVDAEAALDSQYISIRFAGDNVWRAMLVIAEAQGVHIRESSVNKEIEAGIFGDVNSQAEFVKFDAGDMAFRSDAPMLIQDVELSEESADLVNKVYVYGGGDGDAALTMALSGRGFVDSEVVNGRTHYFIADNASISLYGQIARRLDIKRISPTEPTDDAETYAAQALADAGKAWLDRNSLPYELLRMRVQNVNETIQPGDKVHVRYKDVINLLGVPYQERDIDEPYWVMAVEESVSAAGLDVALDVASIDRYAANASDIVVGIMDSINVQNINIQPYPAPTYWTTHKAPIDENTNYRASFAVNEAAIRLNQAIAYIFRDSWTAVAGVAKAGGDHSHVVFNYIGAGADLPADEQYEAGGATFVNLAMGGTPPSSISTYSSSGTHTHETEFQEVQQDDAANLLKNVTLVLDGDTIETGLFPDGDAASYASVNILDALKSGTLRGFHDIEVSCDDGRGDIYLVIFIDIDVSRVRES